MEYLLKEMELCRKYCSLIKKARTNAGFNSLKYPITDVKINRYFSPELRELIAEECNIVGYMNIQPVEFDYDLLEIKKRKPNYYHYEKDGDIELLLCTIKTDWQQQLADERSKKREEAELRKQHDFT